MTLSEFLLRRVHEDVEKVEGGGSSTGGRWEIRSKLERVKVLAELQSESDPDTAALIEELLKIEARPYERHPDYPPA